jgi:hypothetical protein
MAWYEFLVKPPTKPNEPDKPRIKVRFQASNIFEARDQSEAIYGKGSDRSPIVPTKK